MNSLRCLGLLALISLPGCAGAPAAPEAPAEPGTQPAAPPGLGFVCHLNCSGAETTFHGDTDAEARAAATSRVKDQCRPEDGQYFIVCEAAK